MHMAIGDVATGCNALVIALDRRQECWQWSRP